MRAKFLLMISAAMVAVAGSANAQTQAGPETQDQPVQTDEGARPETGGDIVVTAQRRDQRLRDVPISITTLSGDILVESNVAALRDIVAATPGFFNATGTGIPLTFIRGFGSGSALAFDQSVGKFVDGVSYPRDQDGRLPLYDLERIEVLKGPQILLFGNSSTAGAVNITTRKPGSEFAAEGSISYEFNNDELLAQGGVTVPVSQNAAFRIAGFYQNLAKGWVYNDAFRRSEPQSKNVGVRVSFRADLTPDVELILRGEYDRIHDRGTSIQTVYQPINPLLRVPEVDYDDRKSSGGPLFNLPDVGLVRHHMANGELGWDVAGGKLTVTGAYRKERLNQSTDIDVSPLDVLTAASFFDYEQFSQEARFTGSYGAIDVNGGVYHQRDIYDLWLFFDYNLGAAGSKFGGQPYPPLSIIRSSKQKNNNWSVFGELTFRLSDKLSVSAGARQSYIRKVADLTSEPGRIITGPITSFDKADVLSFVDYSLTNLYRPLAGTPHIFTNVRRKESHFQPQVLVQYKPTNDISVYAKFVKGAKAGGIDPTYAGNDPEAAKFGAEEATAWEAGIKGDSADRRVSYALTLFTERFTGLQVTAFDGNSSFVITNVGAARTRGVEAELHFRPVENLQLDLLGSYTDARYQSYPGGTCTFPQRLATPAGQVCRQNLSGISTPFTPKWAGHFGLKYDHVVGSRLRMTEGISLDAKSSYNASLINDPLSVQKGFVLVNANLGLAAEDESWSLTLFGKNLTDRRYTDYSFLTAPTSGAIGATTSRGRQIGLRLGFKLR